MKNPLSDIRVAKHNSLLRHSAKALRRCLERNITPAQIKEALNFPKAEILRKDIDHSEQSSPACLVLGWDKTNRAIHIVIAYVRMLVITVYEPMLPKWATPWERTKP